MMLPATLLALLQTRSPKLDLATLNAELSLPMALDRAAEWAKWLGADEKGAWARVEMGAADAPVKRGGGRQAADFVAFSIRAARGRRVEVQTTLGKEREAGPVRLDLKEVAGGIYMAVRPIGERDAYQYSYLVDGKRVGEPRNVEAYRTPPEMLAHDGVAKGELRAMPDHASQIFPGTTRPWWVYLPTKPAPAGGYALIVFQDGQWAKNYAVPCLDNMIASGDLPPTVAVFIKPGSHEGKDGDDRSREYDVMSDEYVRMLDDEILPKVQAIAPLTTDPKRRAIAGASSGAICAFTAAWERPRSFGLVMSWIGSYTNLASMHGMPGGHNYPFIIRRTEKKPIRIAMQDGAQDIDNEWGNWPLANQTMLAALRYKGYDVWWTFGNGFHSDAQGRSVMPRMLRWLFNGRE